MNGPLLVRALDESGSDWRERMRQQADVRAGVIHTPVEVEKSFEDRTRFWLSASHPQLTTWLQDDLQLDAATARRIARHWWENMRRHFSDPRTRAEYTRAQTTVQDSWQLRRFITE